MKNDLLFQNRRWLIYDVISKSFIDMNLWKMVITLENEFRGHISSEEIKSANDDK